MVVAVDRMIPDASAPGERRKGSSRLRIALIAIVAAGCLVSILLLVIAMPAWILMARGTTFDSPPTSPPLSALSVTRYKGRTTEIHATLARGYGLSDVVDLRLFDGFSGPAAMADGLRRAGPPTGYWKIPRPGAAGVDGGQSDSEAPYYDRPLGRVTLRPYRTPEQGMAVVPVGYPKDCSLPSLFTNASLRAQITALLPETELAALNIHLSDGWGGFEVSLGRTGCTEITLGRRD
jgi:hypothetical protein